MPDRAQQAHLAPVEPGGHDQRAERVGLGLAVVRRAERRHEPLAVGGRPALGDRLGAARDRQAEVVDPGALGVARVELVRPLVDHVHAQPGEVREQLGQRQGHVAAEDLEPEVGLVDGPAGHRVGDVEGEGHVGAALQVGERREVLAPLPRRVVLLVALRQRPQQRAEPVGGAGAAEQVGELVVPGPRGGGEVALQDAQVDAVVEHDRRVARRHPDDDVQPREHRVGDAGAVVDARAAEALEQDLLHLAADGAGVAVARQVDEAGDEAPVRVGPDEHPDLAAFLEVRDALDGLAELGQRRLEQLVARVGLERVDDRLAAVAGRVVAGALDHGLGLLPQDRHPHDALGVGRRREQPEQAVLADHLAVRVEAADADVVEVGGPVHPRAGVVLGHDQQRRGAVAAAGGRRTTRAGPRRPAGCPARCPGPARTARRPRSRAARSRGRRRR